MRLRRLLWLLPLALVVAIAWTAWQAWHVQGSLTKAEASATRLRSAIDDQDAQARDAAVADLRRQAADASSRTDGWWWAALTHAPVLGDDATGVRALSHSLATIADGGVQPLSQTLDSLDTLTAGGRIDVHGVQALQQPVAEAHQAFARADADLSGLDSSGYVGRLRIKFDRFANLVHDTAGALSSADKAVKVLPSMVGADGPRDYLLIFQNNAEIRATGGLPGSWALIHAENGKLSIGQQGSMQDFPYQPKPILPLSDAEKAVYDLNLGTYFADAGFTPDFPRAAELWHAWWQSRFPAQPIDGVVALDPVSLSYLLEGTGPVKVGQTTLTSDNVVESLLSKPYKELDPTAQDALFQVTAKAIFEATTGHLASPTKFVEGVSRAAREGRFLVASFDDQVAQQLSGTRVEGALTGDDGHVPHVDIGVNDGTMSKMSYYLRYWATVRAGSCRDGVQSLDGTMTLNQNISPEEAAKLPDYITGTHNGVTRGQELVMVRIYGPYGGSIDKVSIDGKSVGRPHVTMLEGRPVETLYLFLRSTKDLLVNWTMQTGKGQTGDVKVGMTPSIVPGNNDSTARSAC